MYLCVRMGLYAPVALATVLPWPSLAFASCRSQFKALVHRNVNIGAYEIMDNNVQTDKRDGKTIEVNSLLQVAFPASARLKMEFLPLNFTTDVVEIGSKTWVYADKKWTSVAYNAGAVALAAIRKNGFITGSYRNLECLGLQRNDGINALVFRYTAVVSGIDMPITLYIDAATRLPVKGEGHAETAIFVGHLTTHYRFGPQIKIEPPSF